MRQTIIAFSIIVTTGVFASCSKSGTATPATVSATSSINGDTYTQTSSADSSFASFFGQSANILISATSTADKSKYAFAYLIFYNSGRPAAGSYPLTATVANNASKAGLLVEDSTATGEGLYSSDSLTNVSVTIAYTNNKMTATIPTIKLKGLYSPVGGTTYNDSIIYLGVLVEQ